MDFSFPSFTRASTDLPFSQPPQKSLLELVIEAKGKLGLVPQRKAEKRNSAAAFSAFSDSDEERDDDGEGHGPSDAAGESMSVLTTRTSWVPPTHLLDYFFSGQFMQAFLTLHGITSSRAASTLAPPLLSVRDMGLHPVVETALCNVLRRASSAHHHPREAPFGSNGRGRGGGRGGTSRGQRGGGGGLYGYEGNRNKTNNSGGGGGDDALPLWEVAKLEELKDVVFGDVRGAVSALHETAQASKDGLRNTSAGAAASADAEDVGATLPSLPIATSGAGAGVLFRGVQQVALPALLLGDHVLVTGPRGVGKRTAVLLAAAANTLAAASAARVDEADEQRDSISDGNTKKEEKEEEEGDNALSDAAHTDVHSEATPVAQCESHALIMKEEIKQEPLDATEAHEVSTPRQHDGTTAHDEETMQRADATTTATALESSDVVVNSSSGENDTASRALFVVSSYAEVLAAAQFLESVFGPEAFVCYTFEKDGCTLRPLQEPTETPMPSSAPLSALPSAPSVMGRPMAYLAPPTPAEALPFITDTTCTPQAAVLPLDPTQADAVLPTTTTTATSDGVLGAGAGPDLSELARLVQGAAVPRPSRLPSVSSPAAVESRHDTGVADKDRKRRRHDSTDSRDRRSDIRRHGGKGKYSSSDRDSSEEVDKHRSRRRTSRHHRRHRDEDSDDDNNSDRHHRRHRSSRRGSRRDRYNSSDDDSSDEDDERKDRRRGDTHRSHHSSSRRRTHESRRSERSRRDDAKGHRRHSSHRRSYHDDDTYDDDDHYYRSREDRKSRHRRHRRDTSTSSTESEATANVSRDPLRVNGGNLPSASALSVPPPHVASSAADFPGGVISSASGVLGAPMQVEAEGTASLATISRGVLSTDLVPSSDVIAEAAVLPLSESTDHPSDLPTVEPQAWLPAVLRPRVPVLITTYHAVQTAMEVVGGEATALPPLEQVRTAVLTSLDRALAPPLKDTFSHTWWVSLVNALDVECQFMVSADRGGKEVLGFLNSTVIPDAGERLVHFHQRDDAIWAMMDVQVYAVPVEVVAPASAAPEEEHTGGRGRGRGRGGGGGDRRPRVSGDDIDAAKLTHLFSLIVEHMAAADAERDTAAGEEGEEEEEGHGRMDSAAEGAPTDARSGPHDAFSSSSSALHGKSARRSSGGGSSRSGWQGGRVVVMCSNRREQSLILSQLSRLFRDQQHDARAGLVRLTDAADAFRSGNAEVLVVTDAQLADARVLRDVHACALIDLLVHFSLPRSLLAELEKAEVAEVLAQRGRAVLGHSKPFCTHRWWRPSRQPTVNANGGGSGGDVFVPSKVSCRVLLTEHNMKSRVGTCVMEVLSEVNEV